jgi:hypothetical protein
MDLPPTITSKFIKAFDAKDQTHVEWLGRMFDLAESMGDPTQQVKMVEEVNSNPMKIKLDTRDALDWPHIHFVLCGVYAKAVLRRQAWVPSVPSVPSA